MKSIQRAHIVVVADSDQGLMLAARLRRMEVARVTEVAGIEQARGLCQAGGADACIVALDEVAPDAMPIAESDAPGRRCGVPSLMVALTVTPYLRKVARRSGYYRRGSRRDCAAAALSPHRCRAAAPPRVTPQPPAHAQRPRCAGHCGRGLGHSANPPCINGAFQPGPALLAWGANLQGSPS